VQTYYNHDLSEKNPVSAARIAHTVRPAPPLPWRGGIGRSARVPHVARPLTSATTSRLAPSHRLATQRPLPRSIPFARRRAPAAPHRRALLALWCERVARRRGRNATRSVRSRAGESRGGGGAAEQARGPSPTAPACPAGDPAGDEGEGRRRPEGSEEGDEAAERDLSGYLFLPREGNLPADSAIFMMTMVCVVKHTFDIMIFFLLFFASILN
jgi:hypothetical protein